MRTWTADQFEFERYDTEEALEISAANVDRFLPDLVSFVAATVGIEASGSLPPPKPFDERYGYGMVRGYLAHFAGIELPSPCDWPTHVFQDGPDDWELVMSPPGRFIHYKWGTSA